MAIADAEVERRRLQLPEKLTEPRLTPARKDRDRTEIGAERAELPEVGLEGMQRNTRVVLDDLLRMIEHEVAHLREVSAVHQVGRALEESVAGPERGCEREKIAGLDAAVGKVGAEVIEGLLRAFTRRNDHLHAGSGSRVGLAGRMHNAVAIKADRRHLMDRLARAYG